MLSFTAGHKGRLCAHVFGQGHRRPCAHEAERGRPARLEAQASRHPADPEKVLRPEAARRRAGRLVSGRVRAGNYTALAKAGAPAGLDSCSAHSYHRPLSRPLHTSLLRRPLLAASTDACRVTTQAPRPPAGRSTKPRGLNDTASRRAPRLPARAPPRPLHVSPNCVARRGTPPRRRVPLVASRRAGADAAKKKLGSSAPLKGGDLDAQMDRPLGWAGKGRPETYPVTAAPPPHRFIRFIRPPPQCGGLPRPPQLMCEDPSDLLPAGCLATRLCWRAVRAARPRPLSPL